MKKDLLYIILVSLLIFSAWSTGAAQENKKLAQTGLQFLSVVSDARGAALAGAMTTSKLRSSSLFFNPAGMANTDNFIDLAFSLNEWIADINYNAFSMSLNPASGRFGTFGISAINVDYGDDFQGTIVANNEKGYEDIDITPPTALALGIGYAKALTDKFSVGGQLKWIKQDLGKSRIPFGIERDLEGNKIITDTIQVSNEVTPYAFDFGTRFKTGFRSIVFGMSVRNFSQEIEFAEESFQLPLVFTLGFSVDIFDFISSGRDPESQKAILFVDAINARSHVEQLNFGIDYKIMNILSLRGGYVTRNDESDITYGLGISKLGFELDYAYTPFGVFGSVQQFSVRFWK